MVSDFPRYFFSYSSSSCCLDFFLGSGFSFICAVFLVAFVCSSFVSNSEIFWVRPSRAVSLVELSPISPSAVKAKPPDACSSTGSASCFVSGSGFFVPQLIQNFSSAEISEPHSSQNRLGFSDIDTILA